MTVTEIGASTPRVEPENVANLLMLGVFDSASASSTWPDLEVARTIINATKVIADLQVEAASRIAERMRASNAATFGDYMTDCSPEERSSTARLLWLMQVLTQPLPHLGEDDD